MRCCAAQFRKSHEKSGQHEKKYNPNMWEQLYPAAPAPPAPHVEQAPIGEGDAMPMLQIEWLCNCSTDLEIF
jgi:hypothetical protein